MVGRFKHPLGLGNLHNATFYTPPWGTLLRYKFRFGDRWDDWWIQTVLPGTWYNVVVTYDEEYPDGWNFRWYVNSQFRGSARHTGGILFGGTEATVGSSDSTQWGDYWPGAADEVRVYDYPILDAHMQALYETGVGEQ